MTFKSHVDGKNADVAIYLDRIEWAQPGGVSLTRIATGAATGGISLLKTGIRKGASSEMMPVKAMSSVTTGKDGLRFYKVTIIATGNTVEFRVDKKEGEAAKSLLTQLILGSHPAQNLESAASIAAEPSGVPIGDVKVSVTDELLKLVQLRDAGALTEDEFQTQKAKVLSA
jgi:Short C-terminal domain